MEIKSKKEYFEEIAEESRDNIVEEAYHYYLLSEKLKAESDRYKLLYEEKKEAQKSAKDELLNQFINKVNELGLNPEDYQKTERNELIDILKDLTKT